MRRLSQSGRKHSPRAAILRFEGLEDRRLMSADAGATAIASPFAIGRLLTPAQVAMIPSGPGSISAAATYATPAIGPAVSGPYSPAQIRHAYGIDQLGSYDGTGQTIAIIDAYDNPTVATDLATFSQKFGLPAANFTKVTPPGQATPAYDSNWALEIALDVEWAHAIAPGAKILLVEDDSATEASLMAGVSYAVSQGANQISMSWGGGEFNNESSYDSVFNHPGVTFLASTGDAAGSVEFPAISPYVTSVGGTTVTLDASGNKISESAWSSGGGGPSTIVARPAFQNGFQSSTFRTTPDVAYDADPNSGVLVVSGNNLYQVGGTSVGAPQWAGLIALTNQGLTSVGKSSLGTGQAYGTNSLLYNLAGGSTYTNPKGDFYDVTTGNNSHPATTGYDMATGLGSPVANQLIPDLVGPVAGTTPIVGDSGFEAVNVGTGSYGDYSYNPTGSAWTFSPWSGVAGNGSGFTSGHPNAPQGTQVAFLQLNGSISQTVANWAAGSYTINFDAAQRDLVNGGQDFQVLVDGSVVSTFKPSSTSYQAYTTASFTVAAGAHTIKFVGLDSAGGDNSAFLDAVSVTIAAPLTTPIVGDSGFEAVNVGTGSYGDYSYNPTGSAWTFSPWSGVAGNGSGFTSGHPNAPQGTQVAFLQLNGSISQTVANWAAGSYTINFDAAQRDLVNGGQDFQVWVDNAVVATLKPAGTSYQLYTTSAFTVSAGAHTIKFVGLDSAGGDNSAFLDAVSVAIATPPTTPIVGDSGFEAVNVGTNSYTAFTYNPTGSAWSFSAWSGVTGNGSGFTSGNPNAPQGTQVGFVQMTGSISQTIANWAAGSYTINFDAAQRSGPNGGQDFQVLIDGSVVSTFKPSSTSYQAYTTASFTVSAGAHTIEFLGLDSAGGDNSVFLDAVSIATA